MSNGDPQRAKGPSIERCPIPDVLVVSPRRHGDARGYFSEVYSEHDFHAAGIAARFIQDNQSCSRQRGTVRGLHFQLPPFAQSKLVRVLRGAIFDVAVDIRRESMSFGKFVSVILSAENGRQLYVPAGFAHGFCTLEPDTEVFYKVDASYAPSHESGLAWNDPDIGIDWPDVADQSTLLERDRRWPALHGLSSLF